MTATQTTFLGVFCQGLSRVLPDLFPGKEKVADLEAQLENLQQMLSVTYSEGAREIKIWRTLSHKQRELIFQHIQKIADYEKQIAELTELAITDQLTGLLSRRGMLSRFHGQVISRIKPKETDSLSVNRSNFPEVSALFIDVDKFKLVNDTLGHSHGDSVLIALANIMQESFRTEDILCRLSGDEFLIILPRADTLHAYEKAEKFQQKLRTDARMSPQTMSVTVSIGVASLDFSSCNADVALKEAMELADKAMYQAKNSGRDTIVMLTDKCVVMES